MTKKLTAICCVLALMASVPMLSVLQAQDDEKSMRELFNEAQTASQNEDFEKAVEIFRAMLEREPDSPDIHFFLGFNLHASGDLDEAIVFHKKALKSDQYRATALYNLACAYSIKKESDTAFDYLKKSIKEGFTDTDHINSDADMDNIKDDPRFEQMMAFIKSGGKEPEKLEVEDFYGDWKVVSGTRSGSKIDAEQLPAIKITKEAFTIPSPEGTFVMSYKLDLDATPITVDFKIESGPIPEGQAKGIIKFKDGEMTLCYHPEGEKRPAKFLSTEENGFFVFKMKQGAKTETKSKRGGIAGEILGKWKCIKGMRAGEEVGQERMESVITFEEKMIMIPAGEEEAFEMSYKIDATTSPVSIDMKIEAGPAPEGSKALGIIKMKDGKFHLCYDPMGVNRPEKFESTEENGAFHFVMQRQKKK